MTPQSLFVATVATSLLNGMISPTLPVIWHLYPVWLPELFPPTREVVYYGASLIVSTATLLLAAVPAAISERLGLGLQGAMGVWFGTTLLLVLLSLG
ncbi:MAG: hypothetical protein FJX32_03580 [Alphaproteobacteria bacterium]|nr:hypothetical protein [Alphaproteobacteria bacterium]